MQHEDNIKYSTMKMVVPCYSTLVDPKRHTDIRGKKKKKKTKKQKTCSNLLIASGEKE
jgi:hypothetical protein